MNPASEGLGLESQPAETKADRVNIASNTDFLIAILLIGLKDCPLRYGADFLEEAKPTSSRTFLSIRIFGGFSYLSPSTRERLTESLGRESLNQKEARNEESSEVDFGADDGAELPESCCGRRS